MHCEIRQLKWLKPPSLAVELSEIGKKTETTTGLLVVSLEDVGTQLQHGLCHINIGLLMQKGLYTPTEFC
uniref:Bm14381 n=2 Tax=Brugia TaxID=6278 RepID=A0A1I9G0P9_BRUMA|nr:Bm14381 [Brugia malayi]